MCGGCGQPLRATDPGATVYADSATTPVAPYGAGAASSVAHDAPTLAGQGSGIAAPPLPPVGPAVTPLPPDKVPWPGVTPGRAAKKRSAAASGNPAPWWRIPAIVGVVLVVLVAGTLGAWAFAVQPSMHSDFDVHMQSVLDSGINASFSGATTSGTHTVTIPASAFNGFVATLVPSDSVVSHISIAFSNNQETISYSFWGSTGTVTTNLGVENGHAVARGTSVDCPLCFIETGDQMEKTFNGAFAYIPAALKVTNVQTKDDSLVITFS
jgi:hypothetical protein